MEKIKTGTKGFCKDCGHEIEYVGPYWRHTGDWQPRHIAAPQDHQQALQQNVASDAPRA